MFPTYFAAFAAFFSLVATVIAYAAMDHSRKTRYYAQELGEWVASENKRSKSLKQLADHEAALLELTDAHESLHSSMKKLRSRVGMRELNARRKGQADEVPDSKTDPEAWKAHMRQQLHLDKNFGGK